MISDLLQILAATAGWVHRHQQNVIEYLKEENRVLREQLGPKRRRLTDAQRRRLAAKGKPLGRRLLGETCCIMTPDTPSCDGIDALSNMTVARNAVLADRA